MYNLNQHLHFIGIGGVGMAGIAEVLLNLGYSLSGSDVKRSPLVQNLERHGAQIFIGHSADNLPLETTTVVVSSAIRPENPELIAAHERHVPVIPRAEMLAELMRMKYGIAVAGSHGKTTTTSLVAKVLKRCQLDPTVIIGGRVLTHESGATVGRGQYLVAESDESDGSFNLLRPAIAVVTNIDTEHLGHYGSFGALEKAFYDFMSSVPFYGLVVACCDDPVLKKLTDSLKRRVLSYGISPEAEINASDIVVSGSTSSFTLKVKGEEFGRVKVGMPGTHMVCNALAAIAVGIELGADLKEICKALEEFPGVSRRSEVVANIAGITVVDDYAHHPTEIKSTIAAIRRGFVPEIGGRLIAVFQPHRFSRTRELFSEFLPVFAEVDELIITEIYPAGEEEIPGVSAEALAQAIQHPNVRYESSFADLPSALVETLKVGDVLLTLGAGSIGGVAHEVSAELCELHSIAPSLPLSGSEKRSQAAVNQEALD